VVAICTSWFNNEWLYFIFTSFVWPSVQTATAFFHSLISLNIIVRNGEVLYFLRGADWILKYYSDELRFQMIKDDGTVWLSFIVLTTGRLKTDQTKVSAVATTETSCWSRGSQDETHNLVQVYHWAGDHLRGWMRITGWFLAARGSAFCFSNSRLFQQGCF
jgi:hypothetical protein